MSSSNIPRAFQPSAKAGPAAPLLLKRPAAQPAAQPAVPPKVVLPPKREEEDKPPAASPAPKAAPVAAAPVAAAPVAAAPVTLSATALATPKAAPASQKKEPQPSPRVRGQPLERGMIVAYQETPGTCDASVGTVESVFAAINEVWIIPDDAEDASVRCSTSQVTFLGSWSKTLEIINSIDVPADVEAILGPEQMEQIQDLAQSVPCHLESLNADATIGGSPAQLVFGPGPAKSVKLAVEAVVSHVDGLEFPDVNLTLNPGSDAASPSGWAMPMSNVPMMVVPMWPTAAGWTANPVGQPVGWQMATNSVTGDLTFIDPDFDQATSQESAVTPPWRQELEPPPPPKRQSAMANPVRVKRFRRTAKTAVKEEMEPEKPIEIPIATDADSKDPVETSDAGVKTEQDSSLLYWAKRQHLFKDLPNLPEGWIRVASKSSGGIYYVNLTTGEATFDSPLDLPSGWEVVTSKSTGKQYYWNAKLQISQFERPT